jgi:hypothetical protein
MPAHRNPRWSADEVAILRAHYPLGGIKAVCERLPHRSVYSIRVKLHKLGIKCEQPQQNAPRCVLSGADLEEAIRLREDESWSFERIGARFGCSESGASNAVLNELCVRKGHTPAERDQFGRLTERGLERLRWCLKKGLKGVEIQLRLGVTASCVAEQRRRYNRELKANGKALLPPPGGGERYCGVKLTLEQKREVERLFLEGFGNARIRQRTGVSLTACTRIRARLVRRLKRKGECLPGCDLDGVRHAQLDHARHIPEEQKIRLRELILQRVPVRRAASLCGIGGSSAYRIRDELKAELGDAMPKPRLPGTVSKLRAEMLYAQAIPTEHMYRYRELVRELGDADKARAALRTEIAEAKRGLTFEQQLKLVAEGRASISEVQKITTADPAFTLGGIATGALL